LTNSFSTGKLPSNYLRGVEEFATTIPYNIEWSFVFVTIEPYIHLLRSDKKEIQLLAGWLLAHMSQNGLFDLLHHFTKDTLIDEINFIFFV
jgi:hypothetical protein